MGDFQYINQYDNRMKNKVIRLVLTLITSYYGLKTKKFSLFNVIRWCLPWEIPKQIPKEDPRIIKMQDVLPKCCGLVPVLWRGIFNTNEVDISLDMLKKYGSKAAPGFMKPEGVVVYHIPGNVGFKKTIEKDEEPKSKKEKS